ncbi:hypothetical protein [Rubellimicrobium roseum]|uniref:DUF1311 domain-containing protein n=1 Tax=Rubellimicrobium roseum TaxID=687525 RepID=A0A5C4N8K7_9RHOB|nr:hypothetical protein [Rubellimicrobium roseum]TNC66271.1 hypothetical protein FHG71_16785 [Rubellimicrobium roseum]
MEDIMGCMRIGLALAVVMSGPGMSALAQESTTNEFNDLTPPDMSASRDDREYRVCPDREPRPEWVGNLGVRESYRGVLLMRIYEARSYEAIVATGDCSCANRAPSWDAAEAEYQENYAQLDPQAQQRATSEFRRLKNDFQRDARSICEAQGNW